MSSVVKRMPSFGRKPKPSQDRPGEPTDSPESNGHNLTAAVEADPSIGKLRGIVRAASFGRMKKTPVAEAIVTETESGSSSQPSPMAAASAAAGAPAAAAAAYAVDMPARRGLGSLHGWLLKKHTRDKTVSYQWAKRYFVVDDVRGTISYSKGVTKKPSVVLPVVDITTVEESDEASSGSFGFVVSCPPVLLTLCAEDREDRILWVKGLQKRSHIWREKAAQKGIVVAERMSDQYLLARPLPVATATPMTGELAGAAGEQEASLSASAAKKKKPADSGRPRDEAPCIDVPVPEDSRLPPADSSSKPRGGGGARARSPDGSRAFKVVPEEGPAAAPGLGESALPRRPSRSSEVERSSLSPERKAAKSIGRREAQQLLEALPAPESPDPAPPSPAPPAPPKSTSPLRKSRDSTDEDLGGSPQLFEKLGILEARQTIEAGSGSDSECGDELVNGERAVHHQRRAPARPAPMDASSDWTRPTRNLEEMMSSDEEEEEEESPILRHVPMPARATPTPAMPPTASDARRSASQSSAGGDRGRHSSADGYSEQTDGRSPAGGVGDRRAPGAVGSPPPARASGEDHRLGAGPNGATATADENWDSGEEEAAEEEEVPPRRAGTTPVEVRLPAAAAASPAARHGDTVHVGDGIAADKDFVEDDWDSD